MLCRPLVDMRGKGWRGKPGNLRVSGKCIWLSHLGKLWLGEDTPRSFLRQGPQIPDSTGLSRQLHLASCQEEGPRRGR